jgi:hypothetical protein
MSSYEQIVSLRAPRQQPLFGHLMRLDRAVMQNVADGDVARGKRTRYQKATVTVERLALRAHQANTQS